MKTNIRPQRRKIGRIRNRKKNTFPREITSVLKKGFPVGGQNRYQPVSTRRGYSRKAERLIDVTFKPRPVRIIFQELLEAIWIYINKRQLSDASSMSHRISR